MAFVGPGVGNLFSAADFQESREVVAHLRMPETSISF